MRLIDVHMHYTTPYYRKVMEQTGKIFADLCVLPPWDYDLMMQFLDGIGATEAVLSASSPNQSYGDKAVALDLTRESNETGAGYCAKNPEHLALAIALPLPYVEESLAEIAYGYDTLGCDAVRILSNSCGIYPGDPSTEAVFAELNRRNSVVILHPTTPPCMPEKTLTSLSVPIFEFFAETARAVFTLILSGTLRRYPDIKFVVPHNAGLIMPMLERVGRLFNVYSIDLPECEPVEDIVGEAAKLYYDIAGDPFPRQLDTLLTVADPTHITFATDFPWNTVPRANEIKNQFLEQPGVSQYSEMIFYQNAVKLFPRFDY